MDDKDLNKENEEKVTEVSSETVDDTLEEQDGIKYETNDDWEFDANAPTLDDNIVFENQEYSISFADEKPSSNVVSQINNFDDNSNQIVINKEPLKFVPLAIFLAAVIAVVAVFGVRYYTIPNGKEGKYEPGICCGNC